MFVIKHDLTLHEKVILVSLDQGDYKMSDCLDLNYEGVARNFEFFEVLF